ncbi:MAG: glycosyltransferase family 39 protein, partial [Chloroflexota bacterium]
MQNPALPLLKSKSSPSVGWIILIFVVALIPRVTNLGVFLAHDETLFWGWSHTFFLSLLAGDFAGTIVGPGNPSIAPIWAQVILMGIQYSWAWLNGVQAEALAEWPAFQPHLVFSELPLRRLPVALINTLSVTAIWWFCHRLFGFRLALVAAILIIFDPFLLADSRTGRGEGMLSGFVTLALVSFIFFWVSQSRKYLIFSGVVMGLALLTKMSGVSLVPTVGLVSLLFVWQTDQSLPQKVW